MAGLVPIASALASAAHKAYKAKKLADKLRKAKKLRDKAKKLEEKAKAEAAKKGNPKPSPNFKKPTNPPQDPPATKDLPPGHKIRKMPPTEQYPNGYWRQYDKGGNPVDPSTGKTPGNVTRAESRARTHTEFPPK